MSPATRPIGHGTRNSSINFLDEEYAILSALAAQHNWSLTDYLRKKIRLGVAQTNPEAAKRLAQVRRNRIRAASTLALAIFCSLFACSNARRPARIVRVSRVQFAQRVEAA
jgi:hypothetical protein